METSEPLQPTLFPMQTFGPADFLASPSVSRVIARQAKTSATSGPSGLTSFAKFDPDTSCWKTFRGCYQPRVDGSLETYSETFPRSGLMRNGTLYQRQASEPLISESGCSYLPTPAASSYGTNKSKSAGAKVRPSLQTMARKGELYPTPTANDSKNHTLPPSQAGRDSLPGMMIRRMWATPTVSGNYNRKGASKSSGDGLATQVGGALNPRFVEWLMGFPMDHTALRPSETP